MANSGVNVKMGVSGIQQFKQNMNVAKNSVKTLDAQLALIEKEFKQTGDAETYMTNKAEALKAKMTEQKAIISQAEQALEKMRSNGVTPASKAFQDMQQQLLSAKGALIDTETALDNISGAASDVDENVSGIQGSLQSIDKKLSFQNVTDSIGTITKSLEQAAQKAWELGKRLVQNTLGGGSWADDLVAEANVWEIPPDKLQRMQMTSKIIDTSAETILQAQQKMRRGIGKELGSEAGAFAKALQDIGVDSTIGTGADALEDKFWEIGQALMNFGEGATKENAAMTIFGKSWRELVPLFSAGREEYDKTMSGWNVVTQEQIDSLTKMDDAYQKLENELDVLKLQFEATFAEVLTPIMETLTGLLAEFNEYLKTDDGKKMLQGLQEAVSGLFLDLSNIKPKDVINNLKSVFNSIKTSLEWITNNKDSVVDAMKAIVVGWGALKLTGGALRIWELINGIRHLNGGGTGGGPVVTSAGENTAARFAVPASVSNAASGAALKVSSLGNVTNMTNAAAVGDWFFHQTETGRWMQNQVSKMLGGTEQYATNGPLSEVTEYLEFVEDNWNDLTGDIQVANSWLADWLGNLFGGGDGSGSGGLNGHGADFTDAVARMEEVADELTGNGTGTGGVKAKIPPEDIKNIGLAIRGEIVEGLSRVGVYLDGQKVGQITAPYVGDELAGMVYEFTQ